MTLTLKGCKSEIKVSAKSKEIAAAVYHALAPDLSLMSKTECRAETCLENSKFVFRIETNDIATLRANINSYLRLAEASYNCLML